MSLYSTLHRCNYWNLLLLETITQIKRLTLKTLNSNIIIMSIVMLIIDEYGVPRIAITKDHSVQTHIVKLNHSEEKEKKSMKTITILYSLFSQTKNIMLLRINRPRIEYAMCSSVDFNYFFFFLCCLLLQFVMHHPPVCETSFVRQLECKPWIHESNR